MRPPKHLPLFLAAVLGLPAWAADHATLTSAGYTGLGITPNAHLLDWGRLEATYDNQLPGVSADPGGHNYVLGFGLFPNMELTGRLATNTLGTNCFAAPCGIRDLSASVKAAIGLDTGNRFRIAVGATDLGGAATNFRSYYGVLTYNEGPLEASAGLARRANTGRVNRSPLHGPFAALAWQPLPLLRGHVEYADSNMWGGVRLYAPSSWLPEGWALSVGANVRLTQTRLTERTWFTASLSLPLYKVPALPGTTKAPLPPLQPGQLPLPAYEARVLPAGRTEAPAGPAPQAATPAPAAPAAPAPVPAAPAPAPSAPAPAAAPRPVTNADLHALAQALESKGLEDIWIGRMPDRTIAVRANNAAYAWNAADALGAALGAVARTLGDSKAGYRLVLTQRQVPLVAVTGQADCLRQWIELPQNTCTAGELTTPGTLPLEPLHEGAAWVVQGHKPSTRTLRVHLSPVLRTAVGTEVGALDYSLGANVLTSLPVWAGASVDWGVHVPLANSDDFEPGRALAARRVRSGTDRLTFTQTLRVPLERWLPERDAMRWGAGALVAQATVGRIGTFYDGALGALRWEPGEGRHRLSAEAGWFHNNSYNGGLGPLGTLRRSAPLLGNYRYSVMATRTDLEATAGRFMNNDRGFQLGLRQWFTDVSVQVYYRRTAPPNGTARQMAGIQVSVPIGPRRDWEPHPNLLVGGTPRFSHRVETVVRSRTNPVVLNQGVTPPVGGLDQVFNSDRTSLVYFEDNMRRIRDAAR